MTLYFPNLSRRPNYGLQSTRENNALVSDIGHGYVYGRPLFTLDRKIVKPRYIKINNNDRFLLDEFEEQVGTHMQFYYRYDLTLQWYLARLVNPLTFDYVGWNRSSVTVPIRLEQSAQIQDQLGDNDRLGGGNNGMPRDVFGPGVWPA